MMLMPLLTDNDVARILRLTPRALHQLVAAGEITCVRVGKHARFAPDDVRSFIQHAKVPQDPQPEEAQDVRSHQ